MHMQPSGHVKKSRNPTPADLFCFEKYINSLARIGSYGRIGRKFRYDLDMETLGELDKFQRRVDNANFLPLSKTAQKYQNEDIICTVEEVWQVKY